MTQLILASQSPRREQLLKESGFLVQIDPIKISEIIEENLNPEGVCLKISQSKMLAYREARKSLKSKDFLVVTADTIVAYAGSIFGKPVDRAEAEAMLQKFSGQTHSVWTALSLWHTKNDWTLDHTEETQVHFRALTKQDISGYLGSNTYSDKAGSYGIQDIPKDWVTDIEGSFKNVMGFPVESFLKILNVHRFSLK
jgi:septum formation protein